jgi:hypothetical protein
MPVTPALGNSSADPESGEVQFLHPVFKVTFTLGIELATIADLAGARRGVGGKFVYFLGI